MRLIFFLLLFISMSGEAQWKSFILTKRGDTLNRVDMQGRKQGPWSVSVPDLRGERGYEEEGYFENDQKEGTWRKFSLEGVSMRHGKWIYYDPREGTVESTENWVMNKIQTEADQAAGGDGEIGILTTSDGKTKSDTVGKKATPKPQAILDYEKKNSGKKKVKVRDGNTGN